ncbi:uncharacterized protein [Panulirus ornatus]|uniref:uncharacterized protein n=1 Tax=Panulirus ornatus TaxID=150431 RepID=UPI003A8701F6
MKYCIAVIVMVLVALVASRPDTILDFEGDEHQHTQTGEAGDQVEGYYSWTSPEGVEFYVKYVADEDGYRVLESNAIPISSYGARADGNQGSFADYEGGEGY